VNRGARGGNHAFAGSAATARFSASLQEPGAAPMTLARHMHLAMVCAAFLFVTAIVVGVL
jgi:hypothetical protein